MIATLEGTLTEVWDNSVVLETAGVGYEIWLPRYDLDGLKMGQKMRLYIYDHLREAAHDLYGFVEPSAKELFVQLLSISGVGPKMALAILSSAKPEHLRNAIASGQSEALQTVSGVGKRTAERIVVELKNKVIGNGEVVMGVESDDPAYEALRQLGYSHQQAKQAIQKIPAEITEDGARVKQALQQAGK